MPQTQKKTHTFARNPPREKVLLTKHLTIMLQSGIVMGEALTILISQTKSSSLKRILSQVLADVENGASLTTALGRYPRAFSPFFVGLISIGEESGTLESTLGFLSKQLSKEYALRKKIQGAMLYPGIVVSAVVILGGFISFIVLPRLVDFFAVFDVELPLATRVLLAIATFVRDYGTLLVVAIIAGFVGLVTAVRLPLIRPAWHWLILHLPLFGRLSAEKNLATFTRNLGTLLKSGVPVVRSLEITATTTSNLKFRRDLLAVAELLRTGSNIGDALTKKRFKEFPPLVSKMISVGEKTGRLDETLLYLSDFYEEDIDNIAKNFSTILEPFLLVFIGLLVGFVALAIINPIYTLTGSLSS